MNKRTIKSLRQAIKVGERSPMYTEEELNYLRLQLKVLTTARDGINQARRQVQGFSQWVQKYIQQS